jgi:ABC-2 type transport system permease protein
MTALPYMRFELLRTFRSRRFFYLSLVFPLVMYLLIAGPHRHEHNLDHTGISAPLYFMVGLAAFGAMSAVLSSGGRIASERATGWNRQLRLTPLSTAAYFRAKIVTSYLLASCTLVALYAAGIALGVSMPAGRWLAMTLLVLVGLLPFAALGVLLGQLVSVDSLGPALGGTTALLAFLGGAWFPITGTGFLADVAHELPSYWLVQASRAGLAGGDPWGAQAWAVIAVWAIVLTFLAARAYRRDTMRA